LFKRCSDQLTRLTEGWLSSSKIFIITLGCY
jgi:hypothetical protein